MFSALNHPTRRKIIEMLAHKRMRYTEILEALAIETGNLTFHLTKLEKLVTKDEEGRYTLTERGLRAFSILQQVPKRIEETSAT